MPRKTNNPYTPPQEVAVYKEYSPSLELIAALQADTVYGRKVDVINCLFGYRVHNLQQAKADIAELKVNGFVDYNAGKPNP